MGRENTAVVARAAWKLYGTVGPADQPERPSNPSSNERGVFLHLTASPDVIRTQLAEPRPPCTAARRHHDSSGRLPLILRRVRGIWVASRDVV
ncbi:hypothetical protein GCM10022403_006790 [Streptomyces coacervatus]|uniref:Uncharacterized protein n=1 Tax=Streptomyces coacervatus TaxID=647381 RepID=A0ABP7GU75_9ACTN